MTDGREGKNNQGYTTHTHTHTYTLIHVYGVGGAVLVVPLHLALLELTVNRLPERPRDEATKRPAYLSPEHHLSGDACDLQTFFNDFILQACKYLNFFCFFIYFLVLFSGSVPRRGA